MVFGFPKAAQQRIDAIRYTCSCCGEQRQGELMALAKIKPDVFFLVPEEDRPRRVRINSDLCTIDDDIFLVRAVLSLPVRDTDTTFEFGVWGSLSQQNFQTYYDEYDNPAPAFGPFFSWLNSSVPPYEPGFFDGGDLRSTMHFQPENKRPLIHLDLCDHPLAIDQHKGITVDRVKEIYAAWGHDVLV